MMKNVIRFICPLLGTVQIAVSVVNSSGETSIQTNLSQMHDAVTLRTKCERLAAKGPFCKGGFNDLTDFIDRLAKSGDQHSLRQIIAEELPGAYEAATHYAKLLGPGDGLKFAKTLKVNSLGWRAIVSALSQSNAFEIRAYIGELARSRPGLRWFCYDVDLCCGWGDLVPEAWADLDSSDPIYEGMWAGETVGDQARAYLEKFEKDRPIPTRPPGKREDFSRF